MQKYRCIVFDLDGTLLDTSVGVVKGIDYLITKHRLPDLSYEEKLKFIGPPIEKSIQEYFHVKKDKAWELANEWRDAYKDKFMLEAKPYEGIYELLDYCMKENIAMCVATNKREDYTLKILENFKFTKYFKCIIGSNFEGTRMKSDMIELCIKQINQLKQNCLMIGDTMNDSLGAQKAKVDFLGVTYGFGFDKTSECKSANAVMMVGSCREIKLWLERE